ncbi:mannose-6-phosphate isomerase, partial [Streptococcus sp. GMD2S]
MTASFLIAALGVPPSSKRLFRYYFYKIFSLLYKIEKRVQFELFFCYNEGRKIRQEIDMSEPLFLQSVMQEKIWGGT